MPRTLAIGDIHGCDVALETLLNELQPAREDTVVLLGDVVDRGPDTKRCLEMLLALQDETQLVFILGNHEEMMLDSLDTGDWLDDWLRHGGLETLESYGGTFDDVPAEHLDFLRTGRDGYETATHLFVHASLDPALPLEAQESELLRWTCITGREGPHVSGKRVVCGHRALPTGVSAVLNGWVAIDTWAYGGKYLTALDTDSDLVWQANQRGDLRQEIPLAVVGTDFR